MKLEELPNHIRTRWETAEAINDEKRWISNLILGGQGGKLSIPQSLEEFIVESIEQINKNSNGFYLAWEISRLVADSLSWIDEDEKSLFLDISAAVKSGELAVQKNIPGNSSPLKSWETYQCGGHYLRAESVNDWLLNKGVKFKLPCGEPSQKGKVTYSQIMFERLQSNTKWKGGRITDTDILTLEDAARMASKHAGEDVTVGDYLRAAGRGEILLRAIVHRQAKVQSHDGGVYCNKGMDNENIVPAGSIPTLPLTACQQLAAAGRASWRTFDGFETIGGIPMRFTKAMLTDDEPDFETLPADCRVMGNDVHALADTSIAPESAQATTAAPVVAERRTWWDVSSSYIAEIIKAGQYGTAKQLYRELEAKTGEDSPFDKGTGDNRGSLFVREIAQPLALKTVQNRFKDLRALAKK